MKLVISEAASSNQKATVLLVIDVRRAYFYANTRRRVYIEPAEGDRKTYQSAMWAAGKSWRLNASVHGDDVTVKVSKEDAEWLIRAESGSHPKSKQMTTNYKQVMHKDGAQSIMKIKYCVQKLGHTPVPRNGHELVLWNACSQGELDQTPNCAAQTWKLLLVQCVLLCTTAHGHLRKLDSS